MQERIIGIMGAMPEEINEVVELLSGKETFTIGKRTYYVGRLNAVKTVAVFSRWGKVAAATTVTTLIQEFHITELIFTGVAGAIHPDLTIGDIVIAKRLVQHDMDARPLMKEFEIPLLGLTFIECHSQQVDVATKAVSHLLENKHLHAVISTEQLQKFGIHHPKLHTGDIASGDKFFAGSEDKNRLATKLPSVLCVEMEGAAVAQVCIEYEIPFTILRTISDAADEQSPVDFPSFLTEIAGKYSAEIIKNIFEHLSNESS
jgi:adenosylhomocysteine nucleosidase